MIEAETCSALSAADEPLEGTAAVVHGWVCLEWNGPWGRDVLDGTALGTELAAELGRRASAAGVRIMFIRRPGRSDAMTDGHTVLLARSDAGEAWCEQLRVASPSDLLDLDFSVLSGPAPRLGTEVRESMVLVCAHGKRDQCCAVFGRPVAAALISSLGDRVWECSHTGGHRFAPSMILLPSGYTYGRLSETASAEAVDAADRQQVHLPGLRGRSCWSARGQVAEIAVRRHIGAAVDDLEVVAEEPTGTCVVEHRDRRRWVVETATTELAPRSPSCGAAPKPVRPVVATSVRVQGSGVLLG